MVSHGLVAGWPVPDGRHGLRALPHRASWRSYGGLAKLLPVYAVFFAILTLASIGLPTTSGFTGEFLVLLGAFSAAWPLHLQGSFVSADCERGAVAGVVLGALYMLYFAQRFLFGAAKAPHQPLFDLNLREKSILVAIVAARVRARAFPR